jgi:O-antigen ligase
LGLGLVLVLLVRRIGLRELLRRGWGPAIGTALALALSALPPVSPLLSDRATLIKSYDYDRFGAWERAGSGFTSSLSSAFSNLWSPQGLAGFARVLFGYGPGQSEVILQYATHNLYLRVLFELGILGAVGLVIFLLAVGRSLLSKQPFGRGTLEGQALLASVVALLAMSLFIDSLHWRHLFVFFGIALAIGIPKVVPKEENEQHGATLQVAGEKA